MRVNQSANQLVRTRADVAKNIRTFQAARKSKDPELHDTFVKLLKRGTCFVAYPGPLGVEFIPSKFVGYFANEVQYHVKNQKLRDGRATNIALANVFGAKAVVDAAAETAYQAFLLSLGVTANTKGNYGKPRRYWFTPDLVYDVPANALLLASRTEEDYRSQFEAAVTRSLHDPRGERQARLKKASKIAQKVFVRTTAYLRNPDVVAETLARAKGKCESCLRKAPFSKAADGSPYLEVHHRIPLSQGGEDTVANAIAVCPNCHRKHHYG